MLALAEVDASPELWARVQPIASKILKNEETEVRVRLLGMIEARHAVDLLPDVHALLLDRDDTVSERALRCIRVLADPRSRDPIFAAAQKEEDEYLRVEMAETLLEMGDVRGAQLLVDVISTGEAAQARRDAWEHLAAHVPVDAKLRAELELKDNAAGIADLKRWWDEHKASLKLDHAGVFKLEH
jgi:hypothetical protein